MAPGCNQVTIALGFSPQYAYPSMFKTCPYMFLCMTLALQVQVPIAFTVYITLSVRAFRWLPPQVSSTRAGAGSSTPGSPAEAAAGHRSSGGPGHTPDHTAGHTPPATKPAARGGGLFSSLGWTRGSSASSSTGKRCCTKSLCVTCVSCGACVSCVTCVTCVTCLCAQTQQGSPPC
jgi:hypothetical protein